VTAAYYLVAFFVCLEKEHRSIPRRWVTRDFVRIRRLREHDGDSLRRVADVQRFIENQKHYGLQGKPRNTNGIFVTSVRRGKWTPDADARGGTAWGGSPCSARPMGFNVRFGISPQLIKVAMELGAATDRADIELATWKT